jgi:hypothetical protein
MGNIIGNRVYKSGCISQREVEGEPNSADALPSPNVHCTLRRHPTLAPIGKPKTLQLRPVTGDPDRAGGSPS